LKHNQTSVESLSKAIGSDLRDGGGGRLTEERAVDREAKVVQDLAKAEANLLKAGAQNDVRDKWITEDKEEQFEQYCFDHQHDWESWPKFYPIGQPESGVPNKFKHWLRGTCPPWTCEFSKRQKKLRWSLLIAIVGAAVLNASWVVFACPVGRYCGMCVEQVNNCFGFGRCSLWWVWFWVWFLPMWCVTYTTFAEGFNFNDLYSLGLRTFSVLVEDTERVLLILTVMLAFFLLYLARDSIYKLLGIDDRNIIHYFNLRGSNRRAIGFQVCIWQVTGSQKDCVEAGNNNIARQDTYQRERSLIRTVMHAPMDDNLLPSQGRACNLFVRLAFGDNEPQTSRIVRMKNIMKPDTEVPFRTSFSLECRDDLESESCLHVEVRDQSVMGATELGRVVFNVDDLIKAMHHSEAKMRELEQKEQDLKLVPTEQMTVELGYWRRGANPLGRNAKLNAAEEQVVRMMCREYRNNPSIAKAELAKVGFKPYRLSAGGAVWLGFAQLP
jgi:hypothetical protein